MRTILSSIAAALYFGMPRDKIENAAHSSSRLRRTQPDLPRGFRVPFYPITPILSAAFALYIISQLPYSTFALFAVWLGVAAIIYFAYSSRHSRLARGEAVATEEPR